MSVAVGMAQPLATTLKSSLPAVEQDGQQEEQADRAEDTAQGAHQRVDGPRQGIQRAARQNRLGDLLGGDAEEEHHEHFVDQEVDGYVPSEQVEVVGIVSVVFDKGAFTEIPEVELHHVFVADEVDIGPDQRDDDAENERDGVFLQEGNVPADLFHRRLSKSKPGFIGSRRPATARKRRRLYHRHPRSPKPASPAVRVF